MKYLKYFKEHIAWHPDGPNEVIYPEDVCKDLNSVLNVIGIKTSHAKLNKKMIGDVTDTIDISYIFNYYNIDIMGILAKGFLYDFEIIKKSVGDFKLNFSPILNSGSGITAQKMFIGSASVKDKINNNVNYCYPKDNKTLYNIIINRVINLIDKEIIGYGMNNKRFIFHLSISELKESLIEYLTSNIIPEKLIFEIKRIVTEIGDHRLVDDIKNQQPLIWDQINNNEITKSSEMGQMGFSD